MEDTKTIVKRLYDSGIKKEDIEAQLQIEIVIDEGQILSECINTGDYKINHILLG